MGADKADRLIYLTLIDAPAAAKAASAGVGASRSPSVIHCRSITARRSVTGTVRVISDGIYTLGDKGSSPRSGSTCGAPRASPSCWRSVRCGSPCARSAASNGIPGNRLRQVAVAFPRCVRPHFRARADGRHARSDNMQSASRAVQESEATDPPAGADLRNEAAVAEAGAKDHDRWLTARRLLQRKLEGGEGIRGWER
jgi:hypothetical protein